MTSSVYHFKNKGWVGDKAKDFVLEMILGHVFPKLRILHRESNEHVYIGQTKFQFGKGLKEHQKAVLVF